MKRFDEDDFGLTWLTTMFHADWRHNGATGAEVVRYHLVPDLVPEAVLAIRRDAEGLLDNLDSATIETLWKAATDPDGTFSDPRAGFTTGSEWMGAVIQECDNWLHAKPGIPPLSGADTVDGTDVLGEVREEIGQAGMVPDGVRHALVRCATRCTPELAFRLLLRAIVEYGIRGGAQISPRQYGRLRGLGSTLRYGEFVVSELEPLVAED